MFPALRSRTRFVRPCMFVSFTARPSSRSTLDARRCMLVSFADRPSRIFQKRFFICRLLLSMAAVCGGKARRACKHTSVFLLFLSAFEGLPLYNDARGGDREPVEDQK